MGVLGELEDHPNSGLHSIGVRTEERGSTRNPVAGDWENREGYELVLQDLHFSNGILGVLEAMLGCVR